jgi:ribosomal protein S18 acetylase RimI-like enzyme
MIPSRKPMDFREATTADVEAIATLHADSWRRHYRGSYSDAFLDGDLYGERLAVWTERFSQVGDGHYTVVADDGGTIVGFSHTIFDEDPVWGALLDNLHVVFGLKRSGVGTTLMAKTAEAVIARRPKSGLFLWVLEKNTAAQAFYQARGGQCVGSKETDSRGDGPIIGLRYAWPDPSVLTA